ncbi:GNAT family N-acetyltransferase [Nitrospira moscoviensis]|uniref:Putative N-acetyltransferase n=1 Tax=Nitrospira moscoviensis TaxID=42253 RepID=A0A0K2G7M0_NITMO|nr:GNAT family N-acetyltransferase [Nitrospira moscoviensis]ALA56961.1 putative N-acetyltransferase [Nitrospira moscoviensis]
MSKPTIRPMHSDDREAVVHLLGESDPWTTLGYTKEDWHRIFCPIPQGRDSYVIEFDGRVAGIAIVREKFLLGDYLELLGIAGWARGKGFGARLLGHIESIVFGRTNNLFACVSDFNAAARAFYKKQGYQEIGPMPNFLIPGSAEVLLRKTAGPARGKGQ